MNKLCYSHESSIDLIEIEKYIREELANPLAAKNTVTRITKKIRQLERFAEIGAPLSSIVGIDTDYRYLVCGSYLAFYHVNGTDVLIERILYGGRDYLSILFDDLPQEDIDIEV